MRHLALLAVVAVALVGCGTKKCKDSTLLLNVDVTSVPTATSLEIDVSINAGAPTTSQLPIASNQGTGKVQVNFPGGYPVGKRVDVTVTASAGGTVVGRGSNTATLAAGCDAYDINVQRTSGGDMGGNPDLTGATDDMIPVGTDMTPCPAGTQDHDNNGSCLPDCVTAALTCSNAHTACSDASGTAICDCVAGYINAAGNCVWGTVPADPGFQDTPAGSWTPAGGAMLSTGSIGLVDNGNAVFDRTTVCTGNGTVTQTVDMPTYAQAEPLQIEITSQGSCSSGTFCSLGPLSVLFNGGSFLTQIPSTYATTRICLGERAYGGALPMVIRMGDRQQACNAGVTAYSLSVDHVQIKPNAACPVPGVIQNSDFEAGTNWIGTAGGGSSAIVAGVGVTASKGWQIATTAASCENPSMQGQVSWPLTAKGALSVALGGTAGKNLLFGDPGGGLRWGEYIAPSTTLATQTICLPEYAKGMVEQLQFVTSNLPNGGACAAGDARTFTLDNLSATTSAACPTDASIIDPGFELSNGVINYWATSLNLNGTVGQVTGGIVTDVANAHGGTRVLKMTTQQSCTSATTTTTITVPRLAPAAGPALKFFYKLNDGVNGGATISVGGSSMNLPTQGGYAATTLCIDPGYAGEALPLQIRLLGNGGACAGTFAQVQAFFDDFQATTDATCPVR